MSLIDPTPSDSVGSPLRDELEGGKPRSSIQIRVMPVRVDEGWGLRLARRFGLLRRGPDQLHSPNEAATLVAAALVLLLVSCFEGLVGMATAHMVLTETGWPLWLILGASIAGGVAWATMIFLVERQVLTTDTHSGSLGWIAVLLSRFVMVVGMAFFTAQPIELLLWHDDILQRQYEELARREGLRQREDGLKAEARGEQPPPSAVDEALVGTQVHTDLMTARAALEGAVTAKAEATTQLALAQGALNRAAGSRRGAWSTLSAARAAASANPEDRGLVRARDSAQASFNYWDRKTGEARIEADGAAAVHSSALEEVPLRETAMKTAQDAYDAQRKVVAKQMGEAAQDFRSDLDQRKAWMDEVLRGDPDHLPQGKVGDLEVALVLEPLSLAKRLAILDDLESGRAPRWAASTGEEREATARLFGLPSEEADAEYEATTSLHHSETFGRLTDTATVLAMTFPGAALLFKLGAWSILGLYYASGRRKEEEPPDDEGAQALVLGESPSQLAPPRLVAVEGR